MIKLPPLRCTFVAQISLKMCTLDILSSERYDSLQCRDTANPGKRYFDRHHVTKNQLEERFMDMSTTSLSMEQQFKLEVLREQVKSLSQDQAQEYLLEVMRQNMVKENLLKYWMKTM